MIDTQYLSQEKFDELEQEMRELKKEKMPALAKRIDDARQMGDLSENAEYHAAREDMAWSQSRVKQIQSILDNAQIILNSNARSETIQLGSTVIFTIESDKEKRQFTIVGAQESDPASGKISNESPIGQAFLGAKKGATIEVELPTGIKKYKIISVS